MYIYTIKIKEYEDVIYEVKCFIKHILNHVYDNVQHQTGTAMNKYRGNGGSSGSGTPVGQAGWGGRGTTAAAAAATVVFYTYL